MGQFVIGQFVIGQFVIGQFVIGQFIFGQFNEKLELNVFPFFHNLAILLFLEIVIFMINW